MKLPFHSGFFFFAKTSPLPTGPGLASVQYGPCQSLYKKAVFIMSLSIDEIIENFSFIDDWEERYRYVIELGRELDPMPEDAMTEANKVQGCVSQVWLTSKTTGDAADPVLSFEGDSDAHIVKGLVAIALATYSGKTAREILDIDAEAVFNQIGLREHLTPQRSNGLSAMISRIKADAQASLTQ